MASRTSDDLADRDLAVYWHPASQMRDYRAFPPLPVVSARGCRIELADGRILLDAIASWWCKSLGHGHPRVRAAIEAQLAAFEHVIAANTTSEVLVRLCERLLAAANGHPPGRWNSAAPGGRVPGAFGKVLLACDGSTAVEIALKLAVAAQARRGQPERTRFVALENGYHGETVGALSVGDLGLYAAPYQALTFPATKLRGLPYRSGPDDPRWLDVSAEWPALEAQLEAAAATLAAIVYEPVLQAAGGMRLYSPALLTRLGAWARPRGVLLIADEIAAGMGRLGAMLACHLASAPASPDGYAPSLPDLAVVGKGLTGGALPLSAVLATDALFDLFDGDWSDNVAFLHSNTHTANALAVAAALGALGAYADEDVLGQVRAGAAVMHEAFSGMIATRPWLPAWRGAGLVAAVDLRARDGSALDPRARTGYQVYREAVRRGALLRPLGDTMYLCPPLVTGAEDLRAMTDILAASIDTVIRPGSRP